jgi:hypothetical protein
MKSFRRMSELFNMAGMELPEYLGKAKEEKSETPAAPVLEPHRPNKLSYGSAKYALPLISSVWYTAMRRITAAAAIPPMRAGFKE